jgi:hypothetical protein
LRIVNFPSNKVGVICVGGEKQIGHVRDLDVDDPNSIEHPSHKEQWLALARALGRLDAKRDFEAIHGGKISDQTSTRKTKPGA